MAVIETLTICIGGAVAKAVFKLWSQDSILSQEIGLDLISLISKKVPNYMEKRRLHQQFERIADEVAIKLEPYFLSEFQGIPENEKEAAIIAVGTTIDNTSYNLDVLIAKHLDPISLEAIFTENRTAYIVGLAPASQDLYDKVMREISNYIVEIAITLPDFELKSIAAILKNGDELVTLVKKVLEHLPDGATTDIDGQNGDLVFEKQYRRTVAQKLDWLELFGVDLDPANRRYGLSVGYITLTASTTNTQLIENDDFSEDGLGEKNLIIPVSGDDRERSYVDVERAMISDQKILLRGEAGSGKTTLLQWIAVRSVNSDFEGDLEAWNDTVPFFIQLRRFVESGLPNPEEFIAAVGSNLIGIMPQGWVHRQLMDGRGLVLIDGVDELPEDMRGDAKDWLNSLVIDFPNAHFVVTSRPPAVMANWLDDIGFAQSELQPMTLFDIEKFIDHWHQAALGNSNPDQDILYDHKRLKEKLKSNIRDNKSLRNLATSPLLCAMLCALNRDRRAQVPNDRMALYKVALEMLLSRRDDARDIIVDHIVPPNLEEKQILLQSFAYWLIVNGYSDSKRSEAEQQFYLKIRSMPNVTVTGKDIYNYLLLRSGLIREAVEGRVDFIHRTFQEYLAAAEAINQACIGQLIENAHLDQWREVIVIACGHARKPEREELLAGIISRGNKETRNKHKLHLLAVTCLETSPELKSSLVAELKECLSALIPPTNMSEARSLSSAGDLAVPLLARVGRENARIQSACVRALGSGPINL